jgi:hypothetical protein
MSSGDFDWGSLKPEEIDDESAAAASTPDSSAGNLAGGGSAPGANSAGGAASFPGHFGSDGPGMQSDARGIPAPPDNPPPALPPAWASLAPSNRGSGAVSASAVPNAGRNPWPGSPYDSASPTEAESPPPALPPSWVSLAPADRMSTARPTAPLPPASDQQTPMDLPPTAPAPASSPSPPGASSLVWGLPSADPYLSDEDGRWKQPMRDPATGATGDVDLLHAGLTRIDRSTGTIYANSSQGPIPIGVDQSAAALAQIVQRRNQTDPEDGASNATANDANGNGDTSTPLNPAAAQARLAQIQAQMQNYGGVPQRLETGIAALQAGLTGSDPNDAGTQPARQHPPAGRARPVEAGSPRLHRSKPRAGRPASPRSGPTGRTGPERCPGQGQPNSRGTG